MTIDIGIQERQVADNGIVGVAKETAVTARWNIDTSDIVVVAIEHTLELMAVILTDGGPLILGLAVQCKLVGQHILVQVYVVGQLVVLALCQCTVGIGELCQIGQLGTVVNQVGIILRTLALCKFGCDVAFPNVWKVGVTMEGG